MQNVEELYEEWQKSNEATLLRMETLISFTKLVNDERKQAFFAGFECAMAEVMKYLETLPDEK